MSGLELHPAESTMSEHVAKREDERQRGAAGMTKKEDKTKRTGNAKIKIPYTYSQPLGLKYWEFLNYSCGSGEKNKMDTEREPKLQRT